VSQRRQLRRGRLGSVHGTYGSIEAVESNGRWSDAVDTFRLIGPCSVSRAQRCVTAPLWTDLLPQRQRAFVSRVELVSGPNRPSCKAWTVDGNSRSSANLLSCHSATDCVVAGLVDGPHAKRNGKVSMSSVAWLASETNGKWSNGTLIGYHSGAINEGQVDGLSCP